MFRKTYVKIDNSILTENVEKIVNKFDSYKYYIGVVKANAYGHGDYVVNDLIKGGINYLAVSSLEEAISIRKYNTEIPILVMEPVHQEFLNVILENKITITVDSLDYAKALVDNTLSSQLKVHLKLDTGMNRLGIKDKTEVAEAVNLLQNHGSILLEGIFTHMGTTGISDVYYDRSIERFKELTSEIDLASIPIVHINRSITLVHHPVYDFETGVRLGIIMYGFNHSIPNPTGLRKTKRDMLVKKLGISEAILSNDLVLNTAFSVHSEVMSLRKVKKDDYIGYGANYIAKEDIIVATIPMGYHDGFLSSMQYVSINGKLYELVGDICMDMITVKVDESVKLHDEVEIFGKNIPIKDVSRRTGSNAYHILTGITTRVPRLYSDGVEIKY